MKFKAGGGEKRRHRGSALVMAIVVSVVVTGMILAMAWAAGVQAQMTASLDRVDQAFYAAESGAQRVAWYSKHGKMSSIATPLTGTAGGYGYSTSWSTVSGSTIRIASVGSLGNVAYTCYQTVAPGAAALAMAGGQPAPVGKRDDQGERGNQRRLDVERRGETDCDGESERGFNDTRRFADGQRNHDGACDGTESAERRQHL